MSCYFQQNYLLKFTVTVLILNGLDSWHTNILIGCFYIEFRWSLSTTMMIWREIKEYRRLLASMLMPKINYLQVVNFEHDTANRAERTEVYRKGHRGNNKTQKPMKANYLHIYQSTKLNITLKRWKNSSTILRGYFAQSGVIFTTYSKPHCTFIWRVILIFFIKIVTLPPPLILYQFWIAPQYGTTMEMHSIQIEW